MPPVGEQELETLPSLGNAASPAACSLPCLVSFTPQAQISPHFTAPTSSPRLVINSTGGNRRAVTAWLCNGEELQRSTPGVKP